MNVRRLNAYTFWTTTAGLIVLTLAVFVLALSWIGKPFPGFAVLKNNAVDSLSSSRWTGFQHGIKQRDHILAINGQTVSDGDELYKRVAAYPPGTTLIYTLERPENGRLKQMAIAVPTQRFELFDFVGFFLTFWVVGLFHYLVGWFVTVVKPGDFVARAHLFYCMLFGTFLMTAFDGISTHQFTYFPHNESFALSGFAALSLALLVPRVVPFAARHPWIHKAIWALGFAFMGFMLWSFHQHTVWPAIFLILLAFGSSGLSLMPLTAIWAILDRSTPEQIRSQAKLIAWGALIAFIPTIIINTLDGFAITIPGGEFSYFTLVIFPVVVAYTIVRHSLFGIDVIIKRTVTYAFVTALLTGVYFVSIAGIRSLLGTHSDLANFAATALVAILFAPLRDRTKVLVDKLFFRTGYDLAKLLADFGDSARETFDAVNLLKLFVKTIEIALYPTYVAILLKDEQTGTLILRESLGLDYGQKVEFPMDFPALVDLLAKDDQTAAAEPVDFGALLQATSLPLRLKDEVVGLVVMGPRRSDLAYTTTDRTLLVNLSQQLALWVKNAQLFGQLAGQERLKRELEIAHEVQSGLLPTSLPQLHGVEFSATSIPALEVGGDFYDVIPVDEHRFGVLIGDVSGKGVPAALLMAMTLVIFRSIAPGNASAADVMAKANELIYLNRPSKKMFVTAFYAVYDARDRSLTFANAGNPLPIGTTGRLEAKGVSLGMFPSISYEENRVTMAPGELIVLYSDGAEDAINPTSEQFGEERLEEVVKANLEASPQSVQTEILENIRRFSEGSDQFDDITLVTLRAH